MSGVPVSARLLAFLTSEPLSRYLRLPVPRRRAFLHPVYNNGRPLFKFTTPSSPAMSRAISNSTPAPATSHVEVTRKPRTLVLCFDGTADQYSAKISNVVKLFSILRKDKVDDQLCYYQVSAPVLLSPVLLCVCRRE
jgi:Uncharacterized alpha/beta hydrolase domain (DUF2235)